MQTNANLCEEGELYKKGQALLKAAAEYHAEYWKQFRPSAVVWLEGDGGQLVLFTRGEYKRRIVEVIDGIEGNPLKENFFQK